MSQVRDVLSILRGGRPAGPARGGRPARRAPVRARQRAWVAALAAAAVVLPACKKDEITHFRVPKPAPGVIAPASAAAAPGGGGMGAGMAGEVAPPPAPTNGLRWTLPKGWSEAGGGGGMRYASLKPATPGKIDVSVVVLSGPAGGELANVNRWRGQIGLPPVDEQALATARKRLASKAGPVTVYDFESAGEARTRLVAGIASGEGSTWFVKMVGDAGPVGSARADFIRLLESLRFEAH